MTHLFSFCIVEFSVAVVVNEFRIRPLYNVLSIVQNFMRFLCKSETTREKKLLRRLRFSVYSISSFQALTGGTFLTIKSSSCNFHNFTFSHIGTFKSAYLLLLNIMNRRKYSRLSFVSELVFFLWVSF